MSYRRNGKKERAKSAGQAKWLGERQALVEATGLPVDVVESEESFAYFVDHAHNQAGWLNEAPWFTTDSLNAEQKCALWLLIQQACESLWGLDKWSLKGLEDTYGPGT